MSYRNLAFVHFPNCKEIVGCGPYALVADHGQRIHLYMTKEEARMSAPFYDSRIYDLHPTPCPDLPDDWEDRQRARREARERQEK
jgi:hypothetical protein